MNSPTTLIVAALALNLVIGAVVTWDARKNRIPTYGDDYTINTGAIAWFVGCVIVPLLVALAYLFRRRQVKKLRALPSPDPPIIPEEVKIRCDFDLDRQEALRAATAQFHWEIGDRDRRWVAYLSFSGLAIGSLAYGLFFGFHWGQPAIGLPALILLVLVLTWPRVMAHLAFRGRPESSRRTTWTISSERLTAQSGDLVTVEVQWKAFKSAHSISDGALLKWYNNACSWFPKHGFADDDEYHIFLAILAKKGLLK